MSQNPDVGVCKLCGVHGRLTFEHLPPKCSYNNISIKVAGWEEIIRSQGNVDSIRGRISRRGLGRYSLCEDCNTATGRLYSRSFQDWSIQGMQVVDSINTNVQLYHIFNIYPLRVIKQVFSLFTSVCGESLVRNEPWIEEFVLNCNRKYIPDHVHLFCYGNKDAVRYSGVNVDMNIRTMRSNTFAEFAYPPFGYILSLDGGAIHPALTDISFFARMEYNCWRTVPLKLGVLPAYTWIPGDFRTREEIENSSC